MPRLTTAAIAMFVVGFLFGTQGTAPGRAQEAESPLNYSAGVVDDRLGTGAFPEIPGHEIVLRRITIEPDGRLSTRAYPGAMVIHTESGSWTYIHVAGTARLTRGYVPAVAAPVPGPLIANSALGYGPVQTGPEITQDLRLGTEVELSAGTVLLVEDAAATFINRGNDPAVLLIAEVACLSECNGTVVIESQAP